MYFQKNSIQWPLFRTEKQYISQKSEIENFRVVMQAKFSSVPVRAQTQWREKIPARTYITTLENFNTGYKSKTLLETIPSSWPNIKRYHSYLYLIIDLQSKFFLYSEKTT